MALAERKNAKDLIGIYYINNKWSCIKKFYPETEDLQNVKWSYDNSAILIPDSPTLCILYIYSPLGDLINKIELYKYKMGIKSLNISPSGHYICLGLYDQSLRIFNNISYTCVTIFEHNFDILNNNTVNYYKEEIMNKDGETKYIQLKPPIDLINENILKNINNNNTTKIGISKMAFSFDNYFLATKNDKMPNILFIWDLNQMNLQFVLIQINEVVHFEWGKKDNILFISTNNNKLYYFTLDSCKILQLPKDFNNKSLIFSPDGTKMIMKDINNFIMVNIDNDENINTKVEENYINGDKEGNIDENINEDEIENNIEGEEMEEQINEEDNNNVVFEEEIGMNPDS